MPKLLFPFAIAVLVSERSKVTPVYCSDVPLAARRKWCVENYLLFNDEMKRLSETFGARATFKVIKFYSTEAKEYRREIQKRQAEAALARPRRRKLSSKGLVEIGPGEEVFEVFFISKSRGNAVHLERILAYGKDEAIAKAFTNCREYFPFGDPGNLDFRLAATDEEYRQLRDEWQEVLREAAELSNTELPQKSGATKLYTHKEFGLPLLSMSTFHCYLELTGIYPKAGESKRFCKALVLNMISLDRKSVKKAEEDARQYFAAEIENGHLQVTPDRRWQVVVCAPKSCVDRRYFNRLLGKTKPKRRPFHETLPGQMTVTLRSAKNRA